MVCKYSLKSLAFPAFIYCDVTLDPGILFVVLNPDNRGEERVFWRYMSVDFVNSIDYEKGSVIIEFTPYEEIKNTDESIDAFCDRLAHITSHHSFVKQLESKCYSRNDIEKIIKVCDEQISESIDRMDIFKATRDDVSSKILNRLYDLCIAALLLNAINSNNKKVTIRLAWERSLLSIETKYLGVFLKSLKYIGNRVPDDGQSERLILKYYDFLWQIRKFLYENYRIPVLHNLEKIPLNIDRLDQQYYKLVADAVDSITFTSNPLCMSRYYIQKRFVGKNGITKRVILFFSAIQNVFLYYSVKVVISRNNSEKITHSIFYTAITRAKKKLKIYWSSETMKEVVESFSVDESKRKSLEIVRSKLQYD